MKSIKLRYKLTGKNKNTTVKSYILKRYHKLNK